MHTETTLAEDLLIACLRAPGRRLASGGVLVAGNRSGRITLELLQAGAEVTAHVFDFHHARAIRDRLAEADIRDEKIVQCTPTIPTGPFAAAFFMTTARSMPAELVLDQLEDIRTQLEPGGELLAAFEGNREEALKLMKKAFHKVHVLSPESFPAVMESLQARGLKRAKAAKALETLSLLRAVKGEKDAASPRRSFAAEWPASVPGGKTHTFTSLPGCFCHRRADAGGLALAEIACARLGGADGAMNILDMGCGCGFVGLLVADFLKKPPADGKQPTATVSLTLLDSHARALAAAKINAERLGIAARPVLADDGIPAAEAGTYDVFLGNPPYYGDWRIAETFLSTAKKALREGGICLTVAKHEGGLNELQSRIFGNVEVLHRRGYCVFASTAIQLPGYAAGRIA